MKTCMFGGAIVASVGLWMAASGCSTPDSRVKANEAAFQAWPADVQQHVRAGQVEVGYTKAMVRVALGDPDRVFTRTSAEGTSEVWAYFDHGPKFSFGLGVGSVGRHSATAAGVTVGDNGWSDEEVMRVVFAGETVSAVERRK